MKRNLIMAYGLAGVIAVVLAGYWYLSKDLPVRYGAALLAHFVQVVDESTLTDAQKDDLTTAVMENRPVVPGVSFSWSDSSAKETTRAAPKYDPCRALASTCKNTRGRMDKVVSRCLNPRDRNKNQSFCNANEGGFDQDQEFYEAYCTACGY
jgi:hypothetical protein